MEKNQKGNPNIPTLNDGIHYRSFGYNIYPRGI